MNTTEVRIGLDGKSYSARKLTRQERGRVIRLEHMLIHEQNLSTRAAQQVMADSYGIRRSTGAISADLAAFTCVICADLDT